MNGLDCGQRYRERVVLSRHLMYGAVRLYTPFEQPESNDISPVSDDEDPFSICLDVFYRSFGCSDILIKDEDLIEGF
jgi:hypothetical protein